MSVQVENLEKNMAKLTVTVSADKFEKAMQAAYMKQRSRISIAGFRKGKVPRAMIEKVYGPEVFFEDAANTMINEFYPQAMDESGLDIVSRPDIEVTQIEKGKDFIFIAEVAVKPEVKLGEYKGITVKKAEISVSDEEVDAEIEKTRNMQARTVDVEGRAIAEGDTAVIDYEGFVDDTPFEGGKGENHSLEIGSHSFISGFEEQLVGKNAGDEVDVNVTFPEQYHAKELAGKPALFKVKIHSVKTKEVPELNDEFASLVSEFETMDEYKEDVKKQLFKRKEDAAKAAKEDEAIQKIINSSEMDIPDPMIDMQCENMIQEFESRINQQGLTLEQYMQFSGATIDKMKENLRPEAVQRIQSSLVLEQIANEENIEVKQEEVDEQIQKVASAYGLTGEKMKEIMSDDDKESIEKNLSIEKAVNLIMEHTVEVEETEEKTETEEKAEEA
ncbi:MAG: trigger factor [Eubacterium sp.]|nr:trigger factor [Eubacterium sp.]MCI8919733.1 trigger factor [Eubacterium sp.]